jgi:hypothetical protein
VVSRLGFGPEIGEDRMWRWSYLVRNAMKNCLTGLVKQY